MYEALNQFGCQLLGFDSNANEKDVNSKLEDFSRRMNVRINIYDAGSKSPSTTGKNRQTDALVLTLYRDAGKNCYAVYHENFSELSIAHGNVSEDFDQSYLKLNDSFIPVSASVLALSQLSEFVIPENLSQQLRGFEQQLSAISPFWPFLSQLAYNLSSSPCQKCSVRRACQSPSCGCRLCGLCLKISTAISSCSRCSQTLRPSDMNLIN